MSDFPKYQYSKFIGQDQIVVRSDDKVEFENMVGYVKNFGVNPTQPSPTAPTAVPNVSVDQFEQNHTCPTHGVQMTQGWSKTKKDEQGNPLSYYFHKDEMGSMCFGKGFKARK